MTLELRPKVRYASAAAKTEEGAIENLLRIRRMGQGHATLYSYLCDFCGSVAWSHRTNVRCCSVDCQINIKPGIGYGNLNPRWRGGRYVDERGYVIVSGKWEHPGAHPTRGTVAEHRLVMEAHIGRRLSKHENVHHKNGIRTDNRIENLELWAVPQPYGQRASDLVEFVVDHYEADVRAKLAVKDAVRGVLARLEKHGTMADTPNSDGRDHF